MHLVQPGSEGMLVGDDTCATVLTADCRRPDCFLAPEQHLQPAVAQHVSKALTSTASN
jgi:hypothetical protein